MSQAQEALMMEAQGDMMQMMMSVCRNKTQKPAHSSDSISADERKQFTNCIMKFMEAPMHLQQAMQGQQMWTPTANTPRLQSLRRDSLKFLRDTIKLMLEYLIQTNAGLSLSFPTQSHP